MQTGKTRIWNPVVETDINAPLDNIFFHDSNHIIGHQWRWLKKFQTTKINFVLLDSLSKLVNIYLYIPCSTAVILKKASSKSWAWPYRYPRILD